MTFKTVGISWISNLSITEEIIFNRVVILFVEENCKAIKEVSFVTAVILSLSLNPLFAIIVSIYLSIFYKVSLLSKASAQYITEFN